MKTIITSFILWAVILVFASLTVNGQETVQLSDTNFRGVSTTPLNYVTPEWEELTTVNNQKNKIKSDIDNYEQTQWQSKDGDYCSVRKYNDGMYITAWTDTFYCFISIYNNGDGYWSNDFNTKEYSINSDGSVKFMEALQNTIKVMCEIQMKVYHEQLLKQ